MPRSPNVTDRIILNPFIPSSPDFIDTTIKNEKFIPDPSTSPQLDVGTPIERKHRYAFRLSVQELEVKSHIHSLFRKPQRLVLILLPIALTIAICIITVYARRYVKNDIIKSLPNNSTQLFKLCFLYEDNYYMSLVTLPIAAVIMIIIIFNQTRLNYCRSDKKRSSKNFSIYAPIPFNPFSKVNRFDTMVLSGIVSHEILLIIEEIFLKTTQMKVLTMRGPLFDLIRQIGLVIIIGMRYYPVYTVLEMTSANVLYYGLCALYMWIDLLLRIFEQSYCVDTGPLRKTWHKIQQFQNEVTAKLATSSWSTTTISTISEFEDPNSGGSSKGTFSRFRDKLPIKRLKASSTTMASSLQVNRYSDF